MKCPNPPLLWKLFQNKKQDYPLMRDPKGNPKCYELTDQERQEAAQRLAQQLRERASEQAHTYYGA
jgi:hypothetical protein